MDNLVTEEQINKCLEYVEDKNKFLNAIRGLRVNVKYIYTGTYFPDDTLPRPIYRIIFSRCNYKMQFTYAGIITKDPSLYNLLRVVKNEVLIHFDVNNYHEFCDELGFESNNKRSLQTYTKSLKQFEKFLNLFNKEEIDAFP